MAHPPRPVHPSPFARREPVAVASPRPSATAEELLRLAEADSPLRRGIAAHPNATSAVLRRVMFTGYGEGATREDAIVRPLYPVFTEIVNNPILPLILMTEGPEFLIRIGPRSQHVFRQLSEEKLPTFDRMPVGAAHLQIALTAMKHHFLFPKMPVGKPWADHWRTVDGFFDEILKQLRGMRASFAGVEPAMQQAVAWGLHVLIAKYLLWCWEVEGLPLPPDGTALSPGLVSLAHALVPEHLRP